MFSAILVLLILPLVDLGKTKGLQFRPLSKIAFYIFVANFLVLMQLGAKHVESPFIEFGQISTVLYFAYFILIVPVLSILENTLIDINFVSKTNINNYSKIIHLDASSRQLIWIIFIYLISFILNGSVAEAQAPDSTEVPSNAEVGTQDESPEPSDDGTNSPGQTDGVWSTPVEDLSTAQITDYINTINEDILPDLDPVEDAESIKAWEGRRTDLEDEWAIRDNTKSK